MLNSVVKIEYTWVDEIQVKMMYVTFEQKL